MNRDVHKHLGYIIQSQFSMQNPCQAASHKHRECGVALSTLVQDGLQAFSITGSNGMCMTCVLHSMTSGSEELPYLQQLCNTVTAQCDDPMLEAKTTTTLTICHCTGQSDHCSNSNSKPCSLRRSSQQLTMQHTAQSSMQQFVQACSAELSKAQKGKCYLSAVAGCCSSWEAQTRAWGLQSVQALPRCAAHLLYGLRCDLSPCSLGIVKRYSGHY